MLNRGFLNQSALYAVATVAPIIVNLVVTPYVTRILGADGYGIVAISISLFQFGIVLFTLGLAASITRQTIIGTSGPAGAVATVLSGAGAGILIFLLALLTLPSWGPLLLPGADFGILISPLISCLGLAFLQNAQSFFRAEQRVIVFVALSAAASIGAPLVGMTLIIFVERSPAIYVAGLASTHLAVGILAVLRCIGASRPRFIHGDFSTNLRIGLPTVPHQVATSLLALILVTLTSHSTGLDGAGALQIGMLIGSAPLLLLGAFNNAWAPLIYRASDDVREQVLSSTYRGFMLLTVGLVLGFAALAPVVVPLVAGPLAASLPVTQVALIVALGAPFMTSYLANIHLVFLSGQTAALALTTPISAAAAITLVSFPGLIGARSDIRLLAFALPIFQIFQWIISIKLRRDRSAIHIPAMALAPEFIAVFCALAFAYVLNYRIVAVFIIIFGLVIAVFCYRFRLIVSYVKKQGNNIGRR